MMMSAPILRSTSTIENPRENLLRENVLPRCDLQLVTTNAEFDTLEERWNELLVQTDATIFQTFEWLRTWWKYLAKKNFRLHIVLFSHGDRLVGIAPMFNEQMRFFGMKGVRRMQFIGCGLSDYIDMIIQPGKENVVLTTLADHLNSISQVWDLLDIEDVNEKSCLVTSLASLVEDRGMNVFRYQGNVCPQIVLPNSNEELTDFPGSTKSVNFKRKFKKLQQQYVTEIRIIRNETDDIKNGIEAFSRVHGDRWKSLGFPSAFDDESFKAYHVEFSKQFARRGWLRLYLLFLDNTPAAAFFGFNFNRRIYMYHSNAHGSPEVMKCSPGFLIRSLAMTAGFEEGMKIFDFLRGGEDYKYREFDVIESPNYLIRIRSPRSAAVVRFNTYLAYELLTKIWKRTEREFYGYRRFKTLKPRTTSGKIEYFASIVRELLRLGLNFVARHVPIKKVQEFQIAKKDQDSRR